MPVTKSAAKRVRQTIRRHQRNLRVKNVANREIKAVVAALAQSDVKSAQEKLKTAQAAIDKAAKAGIIHKNKAARKKSQLAKAIKAAGTKPAAKPVKAEKPAAKKPSKVIKE